MAFRDDVQAVIDGTKAGRILETFERYYADDVVMSENGVDPRVGKATNRAYEEAFVNGVDFHDAQVGRVIIDEDAQQAAVEWTLEFTAKGGSRRIQRQVAVQTWRDGQVVQETFYYKTDGV